ncbi:hypothetical protein B1812_11675 [Methylocystis bryophila]|uniref:Uncharacterized protein n=1 Tax=Methylocystis bryophila TaxID=655015 RepID=A0A1W6MVL8_9HYPH|nr:hypothetical protein B1812_11675 [Methylocystis bryophila]
MSWKSAKRFSGQNMLQTFDLARFLIARTFPFERETRSRAREITLSLSAVAQRRRGRNSKGARIGIGRAGSKAERRPARARPLGKIFEARGAKIAPIPCAA